MQGNLVIVESPAKAKTIEKFLGSDYKVLSSYGHIRDLKPKEFSVDIKNGFEPFYEVPEDKSKLVSELKKAASDAEQVWLASDEDREGEAIAWHLYHVLNLSPEKTKRIVFHEITKTAITNAIANPRDIDINLVNAQQARRVLDRIVGFELSPVLWRKVRGKLSAGRVQSAAVRLIVEREREVNAFKPEPAFRVVAHFLLPDGISQLKTVLNKRFKTEEEANAFLLACKDAKFEIEEIAKKPATKSPAPPFTTSTLQQEASRKLGYPVMRTMRVAQKLYEAGLITYMRTDSVNLSTLALNTTKAAITDNYGEDYYKYRKYTTKSKGAQEAHEAIRPTYIDKEEISATVMEQKLYDLIRKRTIASQMADAKLERTFITVSISGQKEKFSADAEVVLFDGFLRVYLEGTDDDLEERSSNNLLPNVNIGDVLSRLEIKATERFTQRPARYTEAALVRRMEELGIGRPSTYAPTIQTVQNREYVIKGNKDGVEREYKILTLSEGKIESTTKTEIYGADTNKLMPTDTGLVVNDFLMAYFPQVLDYNFTARVEKNFDEVAEGLVDWKLILKHFYDVFHVIVEKTLAEKTEHKVGERKLGMDPETGKPVFVKIGRFGPMVQIGSKDDKEEKPKFASLMKGQSIETITLEEALKLFDLPRELGEYEEKKLFAAIGRFGPFIRFDKMFVSIPKSLDVMTITLEEAIQLIKEKREKDSKRLIKSFKEDEALQLLNGRYGAYICYNKKNYKLPKESKEEPELLTYEACKEIISAADKNGTTKATKKKTTTKKKVAKKKTTTKKTTK